MGKSEKVERRKSGTKQTNTHHASHKPRQMAEQSSNSVDLVNEFSMDDIDHLAEFIFDDASPEFELPKTCSRAAPAIDAGITVLKRCRRDAGQDAQLATDALSRTTRH